MSAHKIWPPQRVDTLLLLRAALTCAIVTALALETQSSASAAATDRFLENSPQLKEKLRQSEDAAPDEVKAEIKSLRGGTAAQRAKAAYALGLMGEKASGATLALLEVLEDQTPLERHAGAVGPVGARTSPATEAAWALGKIGRPALDPLLLAIRDRNADVRRAASLALADMGRPAVGSLIKALADRDAVARVASARALGAIRDESAVVPLIEAMKDAEAEVRQEAKTGLQNIGAPALPPLVQALAGSDAGLRREAAVALGLIRDKSAAAPLAQLLGDGDKDVRAAAAIALGEIQDRSVVKALVNALSDSEMSVRCAAALALGKTRDPSSVGPLVELLRKPGTREAAQAADALGEIGEAGLLIEALKDKNAGVRSGILKALSRVPPPRKPYPPLGPLLDVLSDPDGVTRAAAATALRQYADDSVIEALIQAMEKAKGRRGIDTEAYDSALRWLTNQDLGADADAWRRWQKSKQP